MFSHPNGKSFLDVKICSSAQINVLSVLFVSINFLSTNISDQLPRFGVFSNRELIKGELKKDLTDCTLHLEDKQPIVIVSRSATRCCIRQRA